MPAAKSGHISPTLTYKRKRLGKGVAGSGVHISDDQAVLWGIPSYNCRFGDILKACLKQINKRTADLIEEAGLSEDTVKSLLKNRKPRSPSQQMLARINRFVFQYANATQYVIWENLTWSALDLAKRKPAAEIGYEWERAFDMIDAGQPLRPLLTIVCPRYPKREPCYFIYKFIRKSDLFNAGSAIVRYNGHLRWADPDRFSPLSTNRVLSLRPSGPKCELRSTKRIHRGETVHLFDSTTGKKLVEVLYRTADLT
jgi:transcriptional regulator with XRE-family HTH domain